MAKSSSTENRVVSSIDRAAPVARQCRFESISLLETVAKHRPTEGDLPTELSFEADILTEAIRKQGIVAVRLRFLVVARKGEGSDAETLRIQAEYLLDYRVKDLTGIRKPSVAAFGKTTGLFHAWPYWREYVQSTTVRMGLPPLTIPVLPPLAAATKRAAKPTSKRKRLAKA